MRFSTFALFAAATVAMASAAEVRERGRKVMRFLISKKQHALAHTLSSLFRAPSLTPALSSLSLLPLS